MNEEVEIITQNELHKENNEMKNNEENELQSKNEEIEHDDNENDEETKPQKPKKKVSKKLTKTDKNIMLLENLLETSSRTRDSIDQMNLNFNNFSKNRDLLATMQNIEYGISNLVKAKEQKLKRKRELQQNNLNRLQKNQEELKTDFTLNDDTKHEESKRRKIIF